MTEKAKEFFVDRLKVSIYPDREIMGRACAAEAGERVRQVIAARGWASIIFASAPSQLEMLAGLLEEPGIDWGQVYAFHMDEYVGMPRDAPQSFGNYIRKHFFSKLHFREVFYMDGLATDLQAECNRYTQLLRQHPVDISFVGIGENGHLAFNDPDIANYSDPLMVKINEDMDPACRQQQVTDGWFASLDLVPHQAITITIPGLLAAPWVYAVVPGKTKQQIVKRTLEGPIGSECPGSFLRLHQASHLFLDADSAAQLNMNRLLEQKLTI